ncbi:MAG: 50S ribosomal protein L13, partial [Flavobacteriales bacterium]|nr:50S ribosomal protein L13 [Flavobacteriales bacterium]
KYKTNFTPHADCGDNVVIINASKIVMTGDKLNKREIFSHTGFPGGQKRITPSEMLAKDGTSVVRHAIKGMLPKNKLGAAILKNCYIFSEGEHDKEAQKPTSLNLNNLI